MAEEEYLKFHEESSNENNEEKSRDLQAEISKILGKEIPILNSNRSNFLNNKPKVNAENILPTTEINFSEINVDENTPESSNVHQWSICYILDGDVNSPSYGQWVQPIAPWIQGAPYGPYNFQNNPNNSSQPWAFWGGTPPSFMAFFNYVWMQTGGINAGESFVFDMNPGGIGGSCSILGHVADAFCFKYHGFIPIVGNGYGFVWNNGPMGAILPTVDLNDCCKTIDPWKPTYPSIPCYDIGDIGPGGGIVFAVPFGHPQNNGVNQTNYYYEIGLDDINQPEWTSTDSSIWNKKCGGFTTDPVINFTEFTGFTKHAAGNPIDYFTIPSPHPLQVGMNIQDVPNTYLQPGTTIVNIIPSPNFPGNDDVYLSQTFNPPFPTNSLNFEAWSGTGTVTQFAPTLGSEFGMHVDNFPSYPSNTSFNSLIPDTSYNFGEGHVNTDIIDSYTQCVPQVIGDNLCHPRIPTHDISATQCLNHNQTHPITGDIYDDWFLPSVIEFWHMMNNVGPNTSFGSTLNLTPAPISVSAPASYYYWTSSQVIGLSSANWMQMDKDYSWAWNTSSGLPEKVFKCHALSVRPVRRFECEDVRDRGITYDYRLSHSSLGRTPGSMYTIMDPTPKNIKMEEGPWSSFYLGHTRPDPEEWGVVNNGEHSWTSGAFTHPELHGYTFMVDPQYVLNQQATISGTLNIYQVASSAPTEGTVWLHQKNNSGLINGQLNIGNNSIWNGPTYQPTFPPVTGNVPAVGDTLTAPYDVLGPVGAVWSHPTEGVSLFWGEACGQPPINWGSSIGLNQPSLQPQIITISGSWLPQNINSPNLHPGVAASGLPLMNVSGTYSYNGYVYYLMDPLADITHFPISNNWANSQLVTHTPNPYPGWYTFGPGHDAATLNLGLTTMNINGVNQTGYLIEMPMGVGASGLSTHWNNFIYDPNAIWGMPHEHVWYYYIPNPNYTGAIFSSGHPDRIHEIGHQRMMLERFNGLDTRWNDLLFLWNFNASNYPHANRLNQFIGETFNIKIYENDETLIGDYDYKMTSHSGAGGCGANFCNSSAKFDLVNVNYKEQNGHPTVIDLKYRRGRTVPGSITSVNAQDCRGNAYIAIDCITKPGFHVGPRGNTLNYMNWMNVGINNRLLDLSNLPTQGQLPWGVEKTPCGWWQSNNQPKNVICAEYLSERRPPAWHPYFSHWGYTGHQQVHLPSNGMLGISPNAGAGWMACRQMACTNGCDVLFTGYEMSTNNHGVFAWDQHTNTYSQLNGVNFSSADICRWDEKFYVNTPGNTISEYEIDYNTCEATLLRTISIVNPSGQSQSIGAGMDMIDPNTIIAGSDNLQNVVSIDISGTQGIVTSLFSTSHEIAGDIVYISATNILISHTNATLTLYDIAGNVQDSYVVPFSPTNIWGALGMYKDINGDVWMSGMPANSRTYQIGFNPLNVIGYPLMSGMPGFWTGINISGAAHNSNLWNQSPPCIPPFTNNPSSKRLNFLQNTLGKDNQIIEIIQTNGNEECSDIFDEFGIYDDYPVYEESFEETFIQNKTTKELIETITPPLPTEEEETQEEQTPLPTRRTTGY